MTISHLLEDFGQATGSSRLHMTDVKLEEERLEAFEQGYQAGWDDSEKAAVDSGERAVADFQKSLNELCCTYQDAYRDLLSGMQPLVEGLVQAVVPKLATETLEVRITELICTFLEEHEAQQVVISVPFGRSEQISEIAQRITDVSIKIEENDTLSNGKLRLRFGGRQEREIDFDALTQDIVDAVRAFFASDVATDGGQAV